MLPQDAALFVNSTGDHKEKRRGKPRTTSIGWTYRPGATALHMAAAEGKDQILAALLVRFGFRIHACRKALPRRPCRSSSAAPPPARRSAQNFGADVDVKDSQGWRALHLAALHGQAECVDQLMKAGASLEVRGDLGQTALIWAAMWGQADCVTLLCRGGAKTEVRSASAGSALRRAAGLF